MSKTVSLSNFIIQSKIDDQKFAVDRRVIDSSVLLKNICDITEIEEPIVVNCSGESLEIFINLINNYQSINDDEHDAIFENNLYNSFKLNDKQKLIKLIQDLCILDSDFFFNSIADYILRILGDEEKMDWMDIQKYLGLEDDFTQKERNLMYKNEKMEYFLSINTKNFKFPFKNKTLYSLKTDFSTPMNVLIAKIVQRSNEKISYLLSLINKAIKNEVDRHPFKLNSFSPRPTNWDLRINFKKLILRRLTFILDTMKTDEKYFNILKRRKVIAKSVSVDYGTYQFDGIHNDSMDFVISKKARIIFNSNYNSMYDFDIKKCSIPSILYSLNSVTGGGSVEFEKFYNQLIDFSKELMIRTFDIFRLVYPNVVLKFYKKSNASKFERLDIGGHREIYPAFKEFVTKYMADDGIIKSEKKIQGIPMDKSFKVDGSSCLLHYAVSDVKKYLEYIVTK